MYPGGVKVRWLVWVVGVIAVLSYQCVKDRLGDNPQFKPEQKQINSYCLVFQIRKDFFSKQSSHHDETMACKCFCRTTDTFTRAHVI